MDNFYTQISPNAPPRKALICDSVVQRGSEIPQLSDGQRRYNMYYIRTFIIDTHGARNIKAANFYTIKAGVSRAVIPIYIITRWMCQGWKRNIRSTEMDFEWWNDCRCEFVTWKAEGCDSFCVLWKSQDRRWIITAIRLECCFIFGGWCKGRTLRW